MGPRLYLGLDPASSPERLSGYALLNDRAGVIEVGLVATDDEILQLADRLRPRSVAIDAPLSWPHDLDDPHCKGRRCEIELASQGIGIYRTTRKTIIPRLVERGIGLARQMRERGHSVIEIYPYASKVRLFGPPIPNKTTRPGLAWLRERLEGLVECLWARGALGHDQLDAIVAAYTAYLVGRGLTESVGDEAEGFIHLPTVRSGARPGGPAASRVVARKAGRRRLTLPQRLRPTGTCWCGCGGQTGRGSFFLPGHDRVAETAVISVEYGSIAEFLNKHGYSASRKNARAALEEWRRSRESLPGQPDL